MDVSPRIELIVGPMYSGKTSELMRRVRRFMHANRRCLVIKYAHDKRYSEECVASHDKVLMTAMPATRLAEVLTATGSFDVIAVDEAQFFPDVVEAVESLTAAGKVVLLAALDGDFRRKPFGRVLELLPMAEKVDKLTAVCTVCYGEAAFTRRIVASTAIELIGGAESYQPVCRTCYETVAARAEVPALAAAVAAETETENASPPADDPSAMIASPSTLKHAAADAVVDLRQPVFV